MESRTTASVQCCARFRSLGMDDHCVTIPFVQRTAQVGCIQVFSLFLQYCMGAFADEDLKRLHNYVITSRLLPYHPLTIMPRRG